MANVIYMEKIILKMLRGVFYSLEVKTRLIALNRTTKSRALISTFSACNLSSFADVANIQTIIVNPINQLHS